MARLTGAAILAAAAMVLVGAPAAYGATTLYVNAATGTASANCLASTSPCKTIQRAVDLASGGDTIVVAAGTYDESYAYAEAVNIDKSLTLLGAQAGNAGTAARAAESPATESVVTGGTFDVEASDVTVDGFSFAYPGNQACVACDAFQTLSNVTIENNEFVGYEPNNFGPWQADDAIGVNHTTNTLITRNYFSSPNADLGDYSGAVTQWFDGGCSGTEVSGNTFDSADQSALSDIYFFCDSDPADGSEATTAISVSGNHDTITGSTDFALFTHVGGGAEVDVTGNDVSMTSAGGTGIYFSTDGLAGGIGTLDISANTLTGSPYRAVKLNTSAQIPGPVTITGNDFSHNGVGVWIGSVVGTVALHANNFSGEVGDSAGDPPDGVYAPAGGSIDATDNWWGCNAGPGTSGCSGVSTSVLSDPWLVLGISALPSLVPAGGSSTVTADVTHDSAGADTSALGTIPDGTSIAFATDLGSLSASSAGTSGGKASVALTSSSGGTAHVSATLDSQSVATAVSFVSADLCKNGGWKSYGVFKNQGDCVSYAATLGKNSPNG